MRRFVDVVLVRYASVALLLALIIVFSILSPQFLTNRNWQNLLVVQSVVTCMCFAATMPLIVGEFDLSLGSMIGFLAMFGAYLGERGIYGAAIVIPGMLIAGVLVGLINGLLTVKLHISSFIATLGTGIVLQRRHARHQQWAGAVLRDPEAPHHDRTGSLARTWRLRMADARARADHVPRARAHAVRTDASMRSADRSAWRSLRASRLAK